MQFSTPLSALETLVDPFILDTDLTTAGVVVLCTDVLCTAI